MAKMMVYKMPQDEKLLAALGRVGIRQSQLDHTVRMLVKTICEITVDEAIAATHRVGAAEVRKRVEKLARDKLGEGVPLVRLQALLHRARHLTEKRNELLHAIWGGDMDGEAQFTHDTGTWHPAPTPAEVDELADQSIVLANEIHRARLEGFLAEAVTAAGKRKGKV